PSHEALSLDTVIKYSFLGEFELLRFSREDIRDCPWAKPAIREGVMSYYKLLCARKEIERLNIEVLCLLTSIQDELASFPVYIQDLKETDPPLVHEISLQWSLRRSINSQHLEKIQKIMKLPGCS
ncbi:hypothetical protein M422DRAFT_89200, partial [Sphaerobolus stellatus SS14]